jgi:hypothetical protein
MELNVCRPQESAWKPPLPQYAKTLAARLDDVATENQGKTCKAIRAGKNSKK